jgi:cytochrome c oxidase subunit 2
MNGAPRLQSALDGAPGSGAELIHDLGIVLYAGGAAIFAFVICLALYAFYAAPRQTDPRRWLVGGGLAFPVCTLAALFAYALGVGESLETRAGGEPVRVSVVGRQWWWEVVYDTGEEDAPAAVLANELHIPVGRDVELTLSTADVIHSFWVPALAGKVDMIPGRANRLVLSADVPGVWRGQCAEYCGGQHALMALYVVAKPEAEFREWLARQASPASLPADPALASGYALFTRGGCNACHAIRGTSATGVAGPDLTHVGGRRSLAAGVLDNHVGTMAGWIAGAQDLKPGNRMPSLNAYTGRELRTLAAWLGALQ